MADFFAPIFDKYKKEIDKGARLLLMDEADRVIGQAKKLTPVKTGTLRGSFFRTEVEVQGSTYSIEVVNNLDYAVPIEYGHRVRGKSGRWMKGYYMLEQALQLVLVGFSERLKNVITKLRG